MFPLGFIRIIIKCIYPQKKNYDEVYDEIVVELMDETQKDLFFPGPTIMVQVLYALMSKWRWTTYQVANALARGHEAKRSEEHTSEL